MVIILPQRQIFFTIMDKKTMLECLINHYTDGNKAAFAKMVTVTPQTISKWLARNSFDNELLFQKCAGVSASWLLTGEGEMFEAQPTPSISQPVTASSHVTQTAGGAPAETPAAANALLSAKDEMLAAKDEIISALRQSLTDKERLIRTLLAAQEK